MGRGKLIGEEARDVIYQVYLYCSIEAEKFYTGDGYFQRVQHRVAKATGVSLKFIYQLLNERGRFEDARSARSVRSSDTEEWSKSLDRKINENTDEEDTDNSDNENEYKLFFETEDAMGNAPVKPEHNFNINVDRFRKYGAQNIQPRKKRRSMPSIVKVESIESESIEPESIKAEPMKPEPMKAESMKQELIKLEPNHEPVLQTVVSTESLSVSPNPTSVKEQPLPQTIQPKTVQKSPNVTPGPAFKKECPVQPNPRRKTVQEHPQYTRSGQILKVYKVRHNVSKKVIEKPAQSPQSEETEKIQKIKKEPKTEPDELDPDWVFED